MREFFRAVAYVIKHRNWSSYSCSQMAIVSYRRNESGALDIDALVLKEENIQQFDCWGCAKTIEKAFPEEDFRTILQTVQSLLGIEPSKIMRRKTIEKKPLAFEQLKAGFESIGFIESEEKFVDGMDDLNGSGYSPQLVRTAMPWPFMFLDDIDHGYIVGKVLGRQLDLKHEGEPIPYQVLHVQNEADEGKYLYGLSVAVPSSMCKYQESELKQEED